MKYTITIICAAALLVGCKTTSNPSGVVSIGGSQINPAQTAAVIKLAAKYGTLEAIKSKPDIRPYFEQAAAGIAVVINSGNYNPTNVIISLQGTTGNADVANAIGDAVSLYQAFFGDLVANKLDEQSPYTVPVLAGLAAGIQQAVDATAP